MIFTKYSFDSHYNFLCQESKASQPSFCELAMVIKRCLVYFIVIRTYTSIRS